MSANAICSASAAAYEPLTEAGDEERLPRRGLNHESFVLRAGGQKIGVELVDFSADGCCVTSPGYLWRGEQLKLHLPWSGAVDAVVRWCRDGKAGLVFAEASEPRSERVERSDQRISTQATVAFRRIGMSKFTVDVHDISPRGCRLDTVERPAVDEQVLVKFDSLEPIECHVRWIEGHETGVEFDRPIHPAVFDMLAARLKGIDEPTAL
jgi:hypothetical protein